MKKNSLMMAENNSGHACVVSILVFLSFLTMAFAATSLFMPGVAADTGHYEFYLYESGQIEMKTDDEPFTSKNLQNVTLLYSVEGEASEVPYFIPDSLIMESGDNKDDALVIRPYFYDPLWVKLRCSDLKHLENPRPVLHNPRQVVFSAVGPNGKQGIYLVPQVLSFRKDIPVEVVLADNYNNRHPFINAKHNLMAYVSDRSGSRQIFLMDLQTKKSRQLTYFKRAESPCIDAEGKWVYFTGVDENNNYDLYKIRTDGTELTRLTFSPEIEKYPSLTRFGKWLVYERGDAKKRSIWVMTLDGKVQRQISDEKHWFSGPCMSEDGTRLVCEGRVGGKAGIYRAHVPVEVYAGATAAEFKPGIDVEKEVVNLSQFGEFTQEQLAKLSQYGFLVVPTDNKQLFYIYEENEYKKIPSFVTADNLLQLLHIMFNTSLRKTEEQVLLPKLQEYVTAVLTAWEKNEAFDGDQYRTVKRYFQTLYYLLFNAYPSGADPEDKQVIAEELRKMEAGEWDFSAVLPGSKYDYSMFKVRGHYETSEELTKYFKAMMWMGITTFPAESEAGRKEIYLLARALQAVPGARRAFQDIYDLTTFYVGRPDNPVIYDLIDYAAKQPENPLAAGAYQDTKVRGLLERFFQEYESRIGTYYEDEEKNRGRVLTLLGQRYVADSHFFSVLFAKAGVDYLPKGLDLFAAMGNERALGIIEDHYNNFAQFPGYGEALAEGGEIFAGIGETTGEPLYNYWLRLLKTYVNANEQEAPAVFQTRYWQEKKLNTALASWAELKHDTVLYSMQTGAECGNGDEPPVVYGYIEPELGFYKALRETLVFMDEELKKKGAAGLHGLERVLNLVDFFILVSEKELKKIPLSTQENQQLRIIGGLLESCTIEVLDAGKYTRWFEITSESAKNMAVIADVLSYWGEYLLAGVGYADAIYIIIPVHGQLYMMRGAAFSYYEFLHPSRLSDPEWYEMLKKYKIEEKRPKWYQHYIDTEKEEIPVPADPYDSGC